LQRYRDLKIRVCGKNSFPNFKTYDTHDKSFNKSKSKGGGDFKKPPALLGLRRTDSTIRS